MGFVDEIYEMYRNHLKGTEDDAITLVLDLLQDHKREEILSKISEMEDYEIYQMFSIYLIEALKVKIVGEDIQTLKSKQNSSDSTYH